MENKDIRELLDRYLDGTATRAERHLVESHYHHLLAGKDGLASREQLERATERMRDAIEQQAGVQLTDPGPKPQRKITRWLPYAAAILLVASAVGYFAIDSRQSSVDRLAATDILPGGNRATLTLADGRVINLDEAQTGIVIGAEDITYNDGVSLGLSPSYAMAVGANKHSPNNHAPEMLSLTTPKGGQYQITLPDGSKVWLNASSTLKYPDRFPDGERLVEIVGEGYFEIEKDPKRPFRVRSEGQVVDVLGTAFNISAYPDDPETKTTLVTGRVRVGMSPAGEPVPTGREGRGRSFELKPGDQSITDGSTIAVNTVDISDYTDWKNGEFVFREETVQQAMRRLARWYDVEVRYASDIPEDERFSGTISRYDNLGTVLQIMEEAGAVSFEISGRNVLVRRKKAERIKN